MGRGRAKAKQTKVARRLKYSGPDTDLQALENELRGSDHIDGETSPADDVESFTDEYEGDPYAQYVDDYDEK